MTTATTVNIVPRDDNEGKLGTECKQWNEVNAYEFKKNGKQLATLEDCNQSENYLKRETEYKKGALASSLALPSWAILECSLAGKTAIEEDAPDLTVTAIGQKIADGTAEWVVRHKLDGHRIGDIWMFIGTFSAGHPVSQETGLPVLNVRLCDGTNGTINMTNRFPMGTNDSKFFSSIGGANNVVLNAAQMPVHAHGASAWTDAQGNHRHGLYGQTQYNQNEKCGFIQASLVGQCDQDWNSKHREYWDVAQDGVPLVNTTGNHAHNVGVSVANAGGNAAFDNRPAYVAVAFVQKLY